MSWERIKLRDLEKAFHGVFNPELLYGLRYFSKRKPPSLGALAGG